MLTAIGSMLGRAGTAGARGSPLRADLREIGEVAQTRARQRPRPVADAAPVDPRGARPREHDRLVSVDRREAARRSRSPTSGRRAGRRSTRTIGIHVYRVLQEALSNVARHSGTDRAWVRLRIDAGALELEVEDHGKGLDAGTRAARARPGGDARARRAASAVRSSSCGRAEGGTLRAPEVPMRQTTGVTAA